jgi:hypothetical protein
MCGFKKQKKALTFYSQSLICHCNALVLLSFIILPYKTSALGTRFFNHRNKKAGAIPRLITDTKKTEFHRNSVLIPVTESG